MTTIAYRDGVMAADTQATNGNRKCFGINKLFTSAHYLLGVAGPAPKIPAALTAFLQHEGLEDCASGLSAPRLMVEGEPMGVEMLAVNKATGVLYYISEDLDIMELGHDIWAIGTGEDFAMGALSCGATAQKAVEIAMQHCCFTGGTVETVTLDD